MKLFDQFKDAILDEQKEDIALTTSYINNYPPKTSATWIGDNQFTNCQYSNRIRWEDYIRTTVRFRLF